MTDRTVADIIADECIHDDADLATLQAMLDENERLREAVGGLTANVKRWRNRASAERLKRQRWRKRALAAEAEVKRLWKIEIDALWLARLACSSSWPMEMAQQVENAAERVRAAFSDGKEGDRG